MPKLTIKYKAATALLAQLSEAPAPGLDIYDQLTTLGYEWSSDAAQWLKAAPPHPPTSLVYVRVWASGQTVEARADALIQQQTAAGLKLLDRSRPFPCRSPKQLEARVYLTFEPTA